MGWIGAADCARIEALLASAGLPVAATGVDPDQVLDRMQLDKKADRKGVKLILIERLGHAVVAPAPDRSLLRAVIAAAAR
jgi:3-dehydroquinate synthase